MWFQLNVYGLEGLGFDSRKSKRFIASPECQDKIWGLLFGGYGALALGLNRPGREADRHLVPRLIIRYTSTPHIRGMSS
jgi:hypothetical protein